MKRKTASPPRIDASAAPEELYARIKLEFACRDPNCSVRGRSIWWPLNRLIELGAPICAACKVDMDSLGHARTCQQSEAVGEDRRTRTACECEQPGSFNCGLPGILARVTHDGRIVSRVERCDACELFTGDEAAERVLRAHLARLRRRKSKSKGGARA